MLTGSAWMKAEEAAVETLLAGGDELTLLVPEEALLLEVDGVVASGADEELEPEEDVDAAAAVAESESTRWMAEELSADAMAAIKYTQQAGGGERAHNTGWQRHLALGRSE